jgi:hypothetical protein
VRSVGASASTATGTWDNRALPHHVKDHPLHASQPLFQKGVATMITKECFGCEKVTSHEHLHDCAPGIPETHIVGSERFVCVLCKHVTLGAGSVFIQVANFLRFETRWRAAG